MPALGWPQGPLSRIQSLARVRDRVPLVVVLADVGCVHCSGLPGSCHLCHGARRIAMDIAERAMGHAWDTRGCGCDACRRVRLMREAIERG
jgi:hypothetical protein